MPSDLAKQAEINELKSLVNVLEQRVKLAQGRIVILEQELAELELKNVAGNGVDADRSVGGRKEHDSKDSEGSNGMDANHLVHNTAPASRRSGRGGLPFRYREGV